MARLNEEIRLLREENERLAAHIHDMRVRLAIVQQAATTMAEFVEETARHPDNRGNDMGCNFEATIQIDCVKEIVSIIRGGDISRDQVLEIAQHAACFIGSGAKLLEGEDDDPEPIGKMPGDLADVATELESLIPAEDDERAKGIPWLAIVQILLPFLLELLKDRDA